MPAAANASWDAERNLNRHSWPFVTFLCKSLVFGFVDADSFRYFDNIYDPQIKFISKYLRPMVIYHKRPDHIPWILWGDIHDLSQILHYPGNDSMQTTTVCAYVRSRMQTKMIEFCPTWSLCGWISAETVRTKRHKIAISGSYLLANMPGSSCDLCFCCEFDSCLSYFLCWAYMPLSGTWWMELHEYIFTHFHPWLSGQNSTRNLTCSQHISKHFAILYR